MFRKGHKMNYTKIETHQQLMRLQQLAALHEEFLKHGDVERASKTERLAHKVYQNEFILAFCGHFSAGKSTMINSLVGEDILPSSPIPTSANLVKIHRADEGFAKIHFHSELPIRFQEPFNMDDIKAYCKNGDDVYSIEIGQKLSVLPEEVTVLDTPGVDSTDDAHRISTESAIHLADIVFYVMDYNHVQSQLNFEFTKELLEHGVTLYLIINQIDKHNEDELSFEDFKQSVVDSFASWGVKPQGFFFTSLRDPQQENNEFSSLKHEVQNRLSNRYAVMDQSTDSAVSQLVSEHREWYAQQMEIVKEESVDLISENEWSEIDSILTKEHELRMTLEQAGADNLKIKFDEDREKVLQNAYLMPFETRELAKDFLESTQEGFKVGFLFSKAKTEEERAKRLESFLEELNQKVETQLEWHLKSLGKSFLKLIGMSTAEFTQQWDQLSIKLDGDLIRKTLKSGATINGDYVLNYCEDLASSIKRKARQLTDQLLEVPLMKRNEERKVKEEEIKLEHSKLEKKKEVFDKWLELKELKDAIDDSFTSYSKNKNDQIDFILSEWSTQWHKEETSYRDANDLDLTIGEKKVGIARESQEEKESTPILPMEKTLESIHEMTTVFDRINQFSSTAQVLKEKAKRLKQQSFTIALFGAFSAGKSSFSNALFGEKVLPVSPNPTTASINRICPVSEENSHATAKVLLKTEQQLLKDVQFSTAFFNMRVTSLEDAYQQIEKLLREEQSGTGKEKIHLSFLTAFHKGYLQYKDQLGQILRTNMEDYRGFVANESQSCFVESIDLFYDCEVTRSGITLVDTPGADSINARHTGVAFEYIKNADAIIFVTYYNHAFAKADREFLIQLGRVKDSFELDKMFFIVNAIDLAKDEEEKQDVIQYVEEQLVQFGIRFPRLFGVSSLLALNPEKLVESNIQTFKKSFYSFLEEELIQLSIQAAVSEWEKGLNRFRNYIEVASGDEKSKEAKKTELMKAKTKLDSLHEKHPTHSVEGEVKQEIQELLLYVKQRVFLRFSDFYKEAFHPGLFTKESNPKDSLQIGLHELLSSIGYDFAQEMRATSLRVEQFVKKALQQYFHEVEQSIARIQEDLIVSPNETPGSSTIEFPSAFEEMDMKQFQHALSAFKNSKDFYEKGGRKVMQERLESDLQSPADQYLSEQQGRMDKWAIEYLVKEHKSITESVISQSKEQIDGWIEAMSSSENLADYQKQFEYLEALHPLR